VACNTAPVINPPAPNNTLGLLRVNINDDSGSSATAQFEHLSNALTRTFASQNPADALTVCSLTSQVLEDATNKVRFISATLNFKNNLAVPLENLTFHAVHVPGNISGTALQSLRNFNRDSFGALLGAIATADLARVIKPTHLMLQGGAGIEVNPNFADMQIFTVSEAQDVERKYAAAFPGNPVGVLGYGFVAHNTAAGSTTPRRITASNADGCGTPSNGAGRVAFSFRVPYNPAAPNTNNEAYRFELRFALSTSDSIFVTQSLEEQNDNAAVLARAQALTVSPLNPVSTRVMTGSSLGAPNFVQPICEVLTANPQVSPGLTLDGRFSASSLSPAANTMFNPPGSSIAASFSSSVLSSAGMTVRGLQSGVRLGGFSAVGNNLTQTTTKAFFPGEEVEVALTPSIKTTSGLSFCQSVSRFRVATSPGLTLFTPQNLAVGPSPRDVAMGDLNNDGKLDLVVATDKLAVLLGNGAGGFGAQNPDVLPGSNPNSVTLGDLNDDGKLDAVVANRALSSVFVLLGDGTGAFAAPIVTSNIRPSFVALGDLNADGKLDAVVTSANGALSFLGDGTGNLSQVPALLFTGSDGVTLGDLNNDGKLDALMDTSSGFVSLLLGDGVGSFGTGLLLRLSVGGRTTAALGDVNGDGKLDALITSLDFKSVAVRLGDGVGGFTNAASFSADAPRSVKLGDFDGDGKLDALVVNSTFVSVMRGDGTGGFSAAQDVATGTNSKVAALGDLNNDGKLDAVVVNQSSSDVSILLNPDFGNTLGFGNSSATVAVANNSALNGVNGDYTVELWVNIPSSLSATDGVRYNLLSKQAGDPTQAANANNPLPFRLFVQNGQIGGTLCTFDPDATACRATTVLSILPKPLNDNAWHHFALVRQRGIGTQSLSLLVDGVQVGSTTNVFSSSDQIGNTAPLALGADSFSPGFGGALDEVRIWNVARTTAEISIARTPISTPYPTNLLAYFKLNSSSGTTALNEITGGSSGTLLNFPAGNPWQLR
jgi:hypothetical protein